MERDDIRWAKILSDYLEGLNILLPYNPAIINIGCGENVKWNYLGTILYITMKDLGRPIYLGVDIDEKGLKKAWKALKRLVDLVVADAELISRMIKNPFDIAIFEHPDISISPYGARKWRNIFFETREILKDGGILILTSFWLNDHIPATYNIEKAGFHILYNGKNRYPGRRFDISSSGEELLYDKYILIARKEE